MRKLSPIYNEEESRSTFDTFFKPFENLIYTELEKINTEIGEITEHKVEQSLQSSNNYELYRMLVKLKSDFTYYKFKYDIHDISLNDLDSKKNIYFSKVKNHFYLKNVKTLTTEHVIHSTLLEIRAMLVFDLTFRISFSVLKQNLEKEFDKKIDISIDNFEFLFYYLFEELKIKLSGKEEFYKIQLSRLEENLKATNEEIELLQQKNQILFEEKLDAKSEYRKLEYKNSIIPNLHFQNFIIKLEYADFRPLYGMIAEWNLFLYPDGNSVTLTHLIYLFDETNMEHGLYPLVTNFVNSTISIEEFGLFLYQLKNKLVKPIHLRSYNNWIITHFKVNSKQGKEVTDLSRYIKPYKKQVENEQMTDYLSQFLSVIGIN
ncbi:hypothetical protein JCM19275_3185 [Nonlabens ulvanivorans]|uniref:Uncharacterized protein n=1 Tax=Nonlabens ulvanivorans TaxID=906888 RepID=A0A090WBE3_NONUL|nr:hypothetical protein JCM19275_3185 [Nonlabens ulvanivorans]